MLERLVENWLTKVNEKSFQVPFCQMLIAEGYRVVHLSRHGSFEEGKDVLAIDPDGVPCAFQLKGSGGGKITQREWAKYIDQVNRLVEIPIKHPSIDANLPRKVYFVTNGELDEEVRVEISNRNMEWKNRGHPELQTIVIGELLYRFIKIHDDLWPLPLLSEKELLELYLSNGSGYLDKPKLAYFLESLIFDTSAPSKVEISRKLASLAIFASYAISPFSRTGNHVSIIEGWVIYLACLTAFVEKNNAGKERWLDSVEIVMRTIESTLSDLCEELIGMKFFVAGQPLVDAPFYRGRLTWLISFVCVYVLWQKKFHPDWIADDWFDNFVTSNLERLELWGEAAVPQFLAVYWYLLNSELGNLGERLLFNVVAAIIQVNKKAEGLSDPYHSLAEVIMSTLGFSEYSQKENFKGRSYTLDSLIQIFTRRGWRGILADIWKPITEIHFAEFTPEQTWQYCTWHCEEGVLNVTVPNAPQSWQELEMKATQIDVSGIPGLFRENPELLLLFIITYPHRVNPEVIKYLDGVFTETIKL